MSPTVAVAVVVEWRRRYTNVAGTPTLVDEVEVFSSKDCTLWSPEACDRPSRWSALFAHVQRRLDDQLIMPLPPTPRQPPVMPGTALAVPGDLVAGGRRRAPDAVSAPPPARSAYPRPFHATGLRRIILSRDTVHMSLSSKQRVFAGGSFLTACTSYCRPAVPLSQAVCAYDRCTELFHALRDGHAMFPSLRVASQVVSTNPTYFSARLPAQIPEALDHRGWPLVALPVARRSAAELVAVIARVRDKVENAKRGTAGSWARRGQLLVADDIDLLHRYTSSG